MPALTMWSVLTPQFNFKRGETETGQVVGGGTAGLALASRLAAAPNTTVAVIEAGNFYEMDNGNTSQVPGYGAKYLSFNDLAPNPMLVDWGLITEPQKVREPRCQQRRPGKLRSSIGLRWT